MINVFFLDCIYDTLLAFSLSCYLINDLSLTNSGSFYLIVSTISLTISFFFNGEFIIAKILSQVLFMGLFDK